MFTRSEYMAASREESLAAHRRYYGEIAREAGVVNGAIVLRAIVVGKITLGTVARDHALNNVRSLHWWDGNTAGLNSPGLRAILEARGDFVSLSGMLCVLKEAVRIRLEEDTTGTLSWYRPAPLSPHDAWGLAASWGSYIRAGDPGACFCGFGPDFRVQSEAHRRRCLAYADECIAVTRLAGLYDNPIAERAKLRQLKRALRRAPLDRPA